MKRTLLLVALMIITPNAMANEIAGTRVSGQGAVCAEGQGKAVEYNIALREETSYCYEREAIPLPTQEQLETKAKEQIAQTVTEQKNENAVTVTAETTVVVATTSIEETLLAAEVNVATGVTTIREFTPTEKEQVALDRAIETARQQAITEAVTASVNNVGVRQCVNWQVGNQSGTECALEPIPATEEEITDGFNLLKSLFDFDWLAVLLAWLW